MKKGPMPSIAKRFLIWREGDAVKWDCTASELARAVGVDPRCVAVVCSQESWQRRGWFPKKRGIQHDTVDQMNIIPVDTLMRNER